MKNRIKKLLVAILVSSVAIFSAGCTVNMSTVSPAPSVVSIEKTDSNGLEDIYTITYSDGRTSTFTITNGRNGANGQDGVNPSVEELYAKYLELYPDSNYREFLESVISLDASDETRAIEAALCSSAKVFTEFTEYKTSRLTTTKETAVFSGSAVVYKIDDDYTYFITNYHVVYDKSAVETDKIAKKIICYLYGSEGMPQETAEKDENGCIIYDYGAYAIECEYVGGSLTADIAVFKAETSAVKSINENVGEAEFATSYSVGKTAIAIGNPESEGISVTKGIVSVDNEYITLAIDGVSRSYRSIRIDTSIYSGSSGGGLFDGNGKLIGITNAGDGNDQNVNYAVPLEIVKGTVENIMFYNDGYARKMTLGVTVVSQNSKYVYDKISGYSAIEEDVVVDQISPFSIIYKMDVKVGDKITELVINGVSLPISRLFNIGDALLTVRAGDEIYFKMERGGDMVESSHHLVTSAEIGIMQ